MVSCMTSMGSRNSKQLSDEKQSRYTNFAQQQCQDLEELICKALALKVVKIKGSIRTQDDFKKSSDEVFYRRAWKSSYEELESRLKRVGVIFHVTQSVCDDWMTLDGAHLCVSVMGCVKIRLLQSLGQKVEEPLPGYRHAV